MLRNSSPSGTSSGSPTLFQDRSGCLKSDGLGGTLYTGGLDDDLDGDQEGGVGGSLGGGFGGGLGDSGPTTFFSQSFPSQLNQDIRTYYSVTGSGTWPNRENILGLGESLKVARTAAGTFSMDSWVATEQELDESLGELLVIGESVLVGAVRPEHQAVPGDVDGPVKVPSVDSTGIKGVVPRHGTQVSLLHIGAQVPLGRDRVPIRLSSRTAEISCPRRVR